MQAMNSQPAQIFQTLNQIEFNKLSVTEKVAYLERAVRACGFLRPRSAETSSAQEQEPQLAKV